MVGRRDELTYRGNRDAGRHGWLRLTPAYSVKVVEALLDAHDGARVLDPFCGTGTTALCAAQRGRHGTAVDVNPFLVWLATTKLERFGAATLRSTRALAGRCLDAAKTLEPPAPPPIHNVERWWSAPTLDWLTRLHAAIRGERRSPARALAEIAFCRTMIAMSGAAFNHPSMSFREPQKASDARLRKQFQDDVEAVLTSAADAPSGAGEIRMGDARSLRVLGKDRFDLVVTSPPYPNRMSYVRELRPYMYWTGHLQTAREAGELDWEAIGGTWGIATSRLKDYARKEGAVPSGLARVLRRIEKAHEKNGPLLARYLDRYYEDMEAHLRAVKRHTKKGATIHYVIGNASFYGELVAAEKHYAELMERAGFQRPTITTLRKRNSKRELYEYVVSATA